MVSLLRSRYQLLAGLLCFGIAVALVINNQLGGEAMWFWYGTVFGEGAKLYSELHTALQPLFVLEVAAWLRLFGKSIVVYEIPSLIHAFFLISGIFLVLRECPWKDWQKAIALFGTFVFIIAGHSYRFDDYHVLTEALITYALLILLILGRPAQESLNSKQFGLLSLLGLICGLAFVTRVTDGAALITSTVLALPFILNSRRFAGLCVYLFVAIVTILGVVHLTHDSFSAYISSTLFHAAASKGGTGSILSAPWHMFLNTIADLRGQRAFFFFVTVLIALGFITARRLPRLRFYIFPLQVVIAVVMYRLASSEKRYAIRHGSFFENVALLVTLLMYPAFLWIVARYVVQRRSTVTWDARCILLVVPMLEWASYAAGAAAEARTNYYAPAALILLLIPVLGSFRDADVWLRPTMLSLFTLIALDGLYAKKIIPYSWQNYYYGQIFQNHVWYKHPVYGEMYIDRNLLEFSERICSDIDAKLGVNHPELLSLPYPYPNYFCDTEPWHRYVQTFFDTASHESIQHLISELKSNPPQWIVYQRQLNIMQGSERLYNHGQPIPQRDLDALIMDRISSGQWKLVDESSYLRPLYYNKPKETDWYIIETRP